MSRGAAMVKMVLEEEKCTGICFIISFNCH